MYNIELILIKILLLREQYHKYKDVIDLQFVKDNYHEVWYLYRCLDELHSSFDRDFSVDELEGFFYAKYPEASKDIYTGLFDTLYKAEITPEVGDTILSQIQQRKGALKLSEVAFKFASGLASLDDVNNAATELGAAPTQAAEDFEFVTTDLDDLVNAVVKIPGLRWRLDCLNKSLGSLRGGDFGFVFARPETGKTTFLASEGSNFLKQMDKPLVWFNNEEEGKKVALRVYQAYFGVSIHELLGNIERYKAAFKAEVGDRFCLVDNAATDRSKVERILERTKPGLIIYDQIDKIKGFKADRDDLLLGAIYQWARELAKMYGPSLGVCQADGTAEGQKWLTMAHVANAKTAKQAEADFIVGLGKTHDQATEYIRYINISKNKLFGDEDSMPDMKHGRFEVLIEPQIARYRDIVNYA